MLSSTLLQVAERGVFDPIAILFFVGAALFLYGTWVVLRRPSSEEDDLPKGKRGGTPI
jgi:hypothetical protein